MVGGAAPVDQSSTGAAAPLYVLKAEWNKQFYISKILISVKLG